MTPAWNFVALHENRRPGGKPGGVSHNEERRNPGRELGSKYRSIPVFLGFLIVTLLEALSLFGQKYLIDCIALATFAHTAVKLSVPSVPAKKGHLTH